MEAPSAREFHPAANLFPLDEKNIDSLAEDIKQNGLQCPIELLDGKILDGRRRWLATQSAGKELSFVDVHPDDPIAYVVSLNMHRRQLTPAQKALVGGRVREMYDKQAKERLHVGQQSGGRGHKKENSPENLPESLDARDAAGKAVGVSGKSIDFATKVLEHGVPELVAAVEQGRMAISTAAVYATETPEIQRRLVEDPKRRRTYTSISNPPTNGRETPAPRRGRRSNPSSWQTRTIRRSEAEELVRLIKKLHSLTNKSGMVVSIASVRKAVAVMAEKVAKMFPLS